jgi:hypothetical protein
MPKLIALAAVAGLTALAIPLAAQAAPAPKPVAQLSLATSQVKQGGTIHLVYSTRGLPRGSAVRLEGRMVSGTWKVLPGHLVRSGRISEPDSPAGRFQFRLVVFDARHRIASSPIASLTVRRAAGSARQASPSPWWNVIDSGVRGAAEGAAGAAATAIIGWLLCFVGLC